MFGEEEWFDWLNTRSRIQKKNSIVITTRGRILHTVKSSVEKQPAGLAYVKSIRCLHCVNDIFEIPV